SALARPRPPSPSDSELASALAQLFAWLITEMLLPPEFKVAPAPTYVSRLAEAMALGSVEAPEMRPPDGASATARAQWPPAALSAAKGSTPPGGVTLMSLPACVVSDGATVASAATKPRAKAPAGRALPTAPAPPVSRLVTFPAPVTLTEPPLVL